MNAMSHTGFYTLRRFYPRLDTRAYSDNQMNCSWDSLRNQLILQWSRIGESELDRAGPNRHQIALLIQRKYGIAATLVENYLQNFERTLPAA